MNPEWKAKWVAALRSNQFKQGRGRLGQRTPEGECFCVLGVLCEIMHTEKTIDDEGAYIYADTSTGLLPLSVAREAGIPASEDERSVNVIVKFEGMATSLAYLNDAGRLTFPQIADIIEQDLSL